MDNKHRDLVEIDIVILSLERALDTIDAVKSVQAQIAVNPRVWIIDQGSDNQSLILLRNYVQRENNLFLIELGRNFGVPGGRNRGIDFCDAEIVVCIDNDAVFKSNDSLSRIVSHFAEDETLGAIGFRVENYFTGHLDSLSWVYPRSLLSIANSSFLTTRYCGAGHALRRKAFIESGGYDERLFFYWEELDVSYKLLNLGFKIIYDSNVTVLHKISPDGRVNWNEKRFYYLVRNIIYLDWKFFQSILRIGVLIIGYLVKGLYNGIFLQTLKGIIDGVNMALHLRTNVHRLNKNARDYIFRYDYQYRGTLFNRLRREVFEKLPSSR